MLLKERVLLKKRGDAAVLEELVLFPTYCRLTIRFLGERTRVAFQSSALLSQETVNIRCMIGKAQPPWSSAQFNVRSQTKKKLQIIIMTHAREERERRNAPQPTSKHEATKRSM